MDIRNGRYQKADHTFSAEFYDLLNDLEKRLDYAKENTSLPEETERCFAGQRIIATGLNTALSQ